MAGGADRRTWRRVRPGRAIFVSRSSPAQFAFTRRRRAASACRSTSSIPRRTTASSCGRTIPRRIRKYRATSSSAATSSTRGATSWTTPRSRPLRIESSETIDLVRFVDDEEIDPIYFATPYYIAPDGKIATETFCVIMAAMREAHKAGIGHVVLSTRERPVLLAPRRRGMLLMTLRPAEEVRDDREIFADLEYVKVGQEMVEMA